MDPNLRAFAGLMRPVHRYCPSGTRRAARGPSSGRHRQPSRRSCRGASPTPADVLWLELRRTGRRRVVEVSSRPGSGPRGSLDPRAGAKGRFPRGSPTGNSRQKCSSSPPGGPGSSPPMGPRDPCHPLTCPRVHANLGTTPRRSRAHRADPSRSDVSDPLRAHGPRPRYSCSFRTRRTPPAATRRLRTSTLSLCPTGTPTPIPHPSAAGTPSLPGASQLLAPARSA